LHHSLHSLLHCILLSAPPTSALHTLSLHDALPICAGVVHRSEIAEPHAQERPTAWESPNPTRRSVPSLRNRQISRAGTFHRSEIAESHARERPTAQE